MEDNERKISFEANSTVLSLMFTYFHHMFHFENNLSREDEERKREYILSIMWEEMQLRDCYNTCESLMCHLS